MQVLLLKHCQHFTNILICPLWQRVRRYSCLYLIDERMEMNLDEMTRPRSCQVLNIGLEPKSPNS